MSQLCIAMIQLSADENKPNNLEKAFALIDRAAQTGADLVTLPETFHLRANSEARFATAEAIPGPLSRRLAEAAKQHGVFLLAGSYNEAVSGQERLYNTSLFFDRDGALIGKYRKIHLFDALLDGKLVATESRHNQPGSEPKLVDTPFGKVGMSVCYDLRFPELYRLYAEHGASICVVPSNFALLTGKDHWQVLLQARAIENSLFVVAPAQTGQVGAFQSYGRSMIIDPWGTVLACAPDGEGVTVCDIDLGAVARVRERLPSLHNRQPAAYRLGDTDTTTTTTEKHVS